MGCFVSMVAITIKYHKCGSKDCSCYTEGKLHGPFLWLVSSDSTVKKGKKKKNNLKYLGRNAKAAYEMLQLHVPYQLTKISQCMLQEGLEKTIEETQEAIQILPQRSFSREVIHIKAM